MNGIFSKTEFECYISRALVCEEKNHSSLPFYFVSHKDYSEWTLIVQYDYQITVYLLYSSIVAGGCPLRIKNLQHRSIFVQLCSCCTATIFWRKSELGCEISFWECTPLLLVRNKTPLISFITRAYDVVHLYWQRTSS